MAKREDLINDYNREGFVHVPGFLSSEDVAAVRGALEDDIRDVLPGAPNGDRWLKADGKSARNLGSLCPSS